MDYTPVRSTRGKLVHATSAADPARTACGLRCDGWPIAVEPLDCPRCKTKL